MFPESIPDNPTSLSFRKKNLENSERKSHYKQFIFLGQFSNLK